MNIIKKILNRITEFFKNISIRFGIIQINKQTFYTEVSKEEFKEKNPDVNFRKSEPKIKYKND
jgi:hypothetical protein